jgi:glycosyltransferase involved in cell wall biosynthesis
MRVLYFTRSYTPHDRRFLMELAASHHEIHYLRLENDRVPYETRPIPDNVHELPPLGGGGPLPQPDDWIDLAPALESVVERIQPELIHAGPIPSCAFLAALIGFHPLLAMSWGSDLLVDAERGRLWSWMARYALERSDLLVTDCAEVSIKARRLAGLPPDRIVQFPWGVDLASFSPGNRSTGQTAISVRSWEPNYGILHLLEGFRLAHRHQPDLRLRLLGDGSLRPEIERYLDRYCLQTAIELVGAVSPEKLPDYLRAADIYVSCAASDGSSISLLEAMAAGLPAIVTDRLSNREWVADGINGRLVPFGDPAAIANALRDMAALRPPERLEIARRNRAAVEERANWGRNVRKLLAAYEQMCHDKIRALAYINPEPSLCGNHDTG